jgi:chemotaxis signal transduction protein
MKATALGIDRLRTEFDEAFSRPFQSAHRDVEPFLAVTCAERPYAVALSQVAVAQAVRVVTPLPARIAGLLGLVVVHGRPVALYDLAAIAAEGSSPRPPRWLLVCQDDASVAVGVDAIAEYVLVPKGAALGTGQTAQGGVVSRAIESNGVVRDVVDLATVVAIIRAKVGER